MSCKLYGIIGLCAILFSCDPNDSSVIALRYSSSFSMDTTMLVQEFPMDEPSLCYRLIKLGNRMIAQEGYDVLGIYRYPDMTLIHKQSSIAFCDLFGVHDTLYAGSGNSVDLYLLGKDELLYRDSSFSLNKGISGCVWGLQKMGENRYIYPDNYDLPGLSEFHILNAENNSCLSKGEYIEDVSRFKKLKDFKLAYSHSLYVKPDKTLFCLFYHLNRRIRIYNDKGDLQEDVFLDYPPGNDKVVSLKYDRRYSHFQRGFVTNKYIYLFSPDNILKGDTATPEGDILVFDWYGNLVTKYRLNCFVYDFFVDEQTRKLVGSCVNSHGIYGFFKFDLVE